MQVAAALREGLPASINATPKAARQIVAEQTAVTPLACQGLEGTVHAASLPGAKGIEAGFPRQDSSMLAVGSAGWPAFKAK